MRHSTPREAIRDGVLLNAIARARNAWLRTTSRGIERYSGGSALTGSLWERFREGHPATNSTNGNATTLGCFECVLRTETKP